MSIALSRRINQMCNTNYTNCCQSSEPLKSNGSRAYSVKVKKSIPPNEPQPSQSQRTTEIETNQPICNIIQFTGFQLSHRLTSKRLRANCVSLLPKHFTK